MRQAFEEYASGRHTKEQLLKKARIWGLTNRRGRPLTSQAIGMLLRNQLYAGIVDVPEYGVRGKRGVFEPLISEELFYRVQAILSGRVSSTAPRHRAHPDFPLRGFVRCESCGRGLTGTWSKGRNEYYAYYHCRRAGVTRTATAVPTTVLSGRNRVRRKPLCSNWCNCTGFQLLAGNRDRK